MSGVQGDTCKLFKNVVGVSQEVLPIRISRPSLALSLCATRISLLVTPPTTKATMRLPCMPTPLCGDCLLTALLHTASCSSDFDACV